MKYRRKYRRKNWEKFISSNCFLFFSKMPILNCIVIAPGWRWGICGYLEQTTQPLWSRRRWWWCGAISQQQFQHHQFIVVCPFVRYCFGGSELALSWAEPFVSFVRKTIENWYIFASFRGKYVDCQYRRNTWKCEYKLMTISKSLQSNWGFFWVLLIPKNITLFSL